MRKCGLGSVNYVSTLITKRLRGICHAWHFYFALGFVFKALCGNLVLRACTP
ncbi:DUF3265 domain-containing protein [Vibrio parahaemolyticus]|nr:DUF3265 domain-containing protein [Vibrio parahaemolyticus]